MSLLRVMYKSRHVSAASSAFFHRKLCDNLPWTRHQIRTCSQQAANVSPIQNIQKPRELDLTASSQLKGNIEKSTERKGIIQRSLFKANVLIEELSHMDEVREAQDRVIQLKDKLIESGQQKRDILHKLSEIRRELKQIHADSIAIRRGTDGYLTLVHNEIRLLKDEERLQSEYDEADDEERKLFTHLTAAINDSYEKEKVHANTLRLWGLIGTLITSVFTLVLSTIGHYYHTTQLGLVGSKFKDTESIHREIRSLRDILLAMQAHSESEVKTQQKGPVANPQASGESWGAYFSRKISGIFRYFYPKKP